MRTLVSSTICVLGLLCVVAAGRADDGFRPLFDGKTLDGWDGDAELWSVEDGTIVGTTDEKKLDHNSFLNTTDTFDNFVLRLKFKLRNHNSGVQFRSKLYDDHVVKGYQADIADERYMGILYEEGGRGILADVDPEQVAPHFKPDEWNEYVITADGGHITEQLNGYTTVDYTETSDEGAKDGIIALQLHVGPKMRIWFKDVEIKELD